LQVADTAGSVIFRTNHKSHGATDSGNFVRFHCRTATGAMANVMNINGAKGLHCYGTITTSAGFTSTSDRNLKEQVQDVDLSGLQKLYP
jgi:hypothetical protein